MTSNTLNDIALRRLTSGPTTADKAALSSLGFNAWLAQQLEGDHRTDPEADRRIAEATLHVKYASNPANDYPAVDDQHHGTGKASLSRRRARVVCNWAFRACRKLMPRGVASAHTRVARPAYPGRQWHDVRGNKAGKVQQDTLGSHGKY